MKKGIFEGVIHKNLLFKTGIITAVFGGICTKLSYAFIVMVSLFFITFVSSILTAVFMTGKSETIKVIFNAGVSSVCYIPTYLLLENISPEFISSATGYLPLTVICSVWIYRTQQKTFDEDENLVIAVLRLFMFLLSTVISVLILAFIREFLAYGTLFGKKVLENAPIGSADEAWFGVLIVGIIAGLLKISRDKTAKKNTENNKALSEG